MDTGPGTAWAEEVERDKEMRKGRMERKEEKRWKRR